MVWYGLIWSDMVWYGLICENGDISPTNESHFFFVSENGGFFVPQAFFHGENDETTSGLPSKWRLPLRHEGTLKSSKPWTTMTQYWNPHGFWIPDRHEIPNHVLNPRRWIDLQDDSRFRLAICWCLSGSVVSGMIRDEETTSETGATGTGWVT